MRLTDRHPDLEELSPSYLESARRSGGWERAEHRAVLPGPGAPTAGARRGALPLPRRPGRETKEDHDAARGAPREGSREATGRERMTEQVGPWGRREYEDYEELGRRLEVLDAALLAFQQQVVKMWGLGSGEAEETRHLAPDVPVLEMVLRLQRLHQQLTREFSAEVEEADVPEGKPRCPTPFDRREL